MRKPRLFATVAPSSITAAVKGSWTLEANSLTSM